MSISSNKFLANTSISTVNQYQIQNKLASKLNRQSNIQKDNELMDACKSFEIYFVEKVFQEMKKTVPKNVNKEDTYSYFDDMLYTEYAKGITEQGKLGIANMLYESMKRNY